MGIDIIDTLLCISAVLSVICYVVIIKKIRTFGHFDTEDKVFIGLFFIGATVPIVNAIGLAVTIADIIMIKRKQIKNIPPSLITLVKTFIANKDYEYMDSREESTHIKNNKLEIKVYKTHINFKHRDYSTDLFAKDLKRIQNEKAESVTEQLLDAYIKTRKGTA